MIVKSTMIVVFLYKASDGRLDMDITLNLCDQHYH